MFYYSFPGCSFFFIYFFRSGNQLAHTNSTLSCHDESTVAQRAETTFHYRCDNNCVFGDAAADGDGDGDDDNDDHIYA